MNRLERLLLRGKCCPKDAGQNIVSLIRNNCTTLREVNTGTIMPLPADGEEYEVLEKLTCPALPDSVRKRCPALRKVIENLCDLCIECYLRIIFRLKLQ